MVLFVVHFLTPDGHQWISQVEWRTSWVGWSDTAFDLVLESGDIPCSAEVSWTLLVPVLSWGPLEVSRMLLLVL